MGQSVEIRSPRQPHPVPLRQRFIPRRVCRVMLGVVNLYSSKIKSQEPLHQLVIPHQLRMSQHRNAAGLPEARHRLLRHDHNIPNIRQPPMVSQLGEGFVHRRDNPLFHQRPRHMRPSDGAAGSGDG